MILHFKRFLTCQCQNRTQSGLDAPRDIRPTNYPRGLVIHGLIFSKHNQCLQHQYGTTTSALATQTYLTIIWLGNEDRYSSKSKDMVEPVYVYCLRKWL
jgi:hypothetical protein